MADDDRAAADRMTPPAAAAQLFEAIGAEPHAYDFFQALRRIDAIHGERPRLGESASPSTDPVRIGQEPALTFAPRPLAALSDGHAGAPLLSTYFFGLFGPNAPLPLHITEFAFSRLHNHGDPAIARFADIFHHRMASLLFRAWAESEPTVSHDRPQEDRFGMQLAALAGLGMPSLRDRDAMPDLLKLHFVGRLASHTRNPEGLQAILASFFAAPVRLLEFVPKWIDLPPNSLCLLGRDRATGTLGSTATAGRRIKVYQHRFRIVIGPLSLVQYERLLPGAEGLGRMIPVVRNYVGDELDWELNLVLRADEVPSVRLGRSGRLGWTGWMGKPPQGRHADDLKMTPLKMTPQAFAPGRKPPSSEAEDRRP